MQHFVFHIDLYCCSSFFIVYYHVLILLMVCTSVVYSAGFIDVAAINTVLQSVCAHARVHISLGNPTVGLTLLGCRMFLPSAVPDNARLFSDGSIFSVPVSHPH